MDARPGNDLKARVEFYSDWDYNIKVAGVKFRQSELDKLYEVDWNQVQIDLQEEPENKFDPNAIAIWANQASTDSIQVGYIPATVAPHIKEMLNNGETFECALIYITDNTRGRAAQRGGQGIRTAKIAVRRK